jgi:hypothetical protein
MKLTRRGFLEQLSFAGAACAVAAPRSAPANPAAGHEQDWRWLVGNWDVWHERLRGRLEGSTTWDKFAGKSNCWLTLGGLGTIDDNLLDLPAGTYRAVGARAFDPATNQWAIWWLDGRMAGKLDAPVRGGFRGTEGEFQGPDVYRGTPVTVRFRWHETHSRRPHWDQAYSTDDGKSWEINWRNYFTRTSETPTSVPLDSNETAAAEAADFRFLIGKWKVHNRRRRPDGSWEEFDGTLTNWSVMGGLGNVGDNVFHAPSGLHRGMSVRAFDTSARQWRSWWLDARTPRDIAPALSGTFANGVGTLIGEDELEGRKRQLRSQWTRTHSNNPRWEQATSLDGKTWETNWSAELTRTGA